MAAFHQFGVEMFGSASPGGCGDYLVAKEVFNTLASRLSLEFNSIAAPMPHGYQKALVSYFESHNENLCTHMSGAAGQKPDAHPRLQKPSLFGQCQGCPEGCSKPPLRRVHRSL
jgi:hypothetical protein